MTVGSFYLPWEGLLGGLVVILLLGNMIVLLRRGASKELSSLADTLFRGQAELAGRLTQLSENNQNSQNRIAEAINEQKLSVLKIMDEKLLAVTKSSRRRIAAVNRQNDRKRCTTCVNVWPR